MQEATRAKLDDWREQLEPMLDGLQDFVAGPDQPLDLSVDSLRHLEDVLLGETPAGQPPRSGLVEACGGYLGEVLLTVGGGAWGWDPRSDLPVARLDVGGGAADGGTADGGTANGGAGSTAEPMQLVLDALVERSGTVWSTEYERIRALAVARRSEEPTWEPRRTDRPALGTAPSDAAADPWLTRWLAAREQAFPAWSAATGRAGDLDFSPGSLLALEQVVRSRVPTKDALHELKDGDFVQGAVWYLGEVARRHRDAHWRYSPDPGGTSRNPYAGRPFVEQDDDGGDAIPLLELETAVLSEETGVLLERFEMFD